MLVLARRPQTAAALALGRQFTRSSVRLETALPAHHPSSSDASPSSPAPPSEISPKLPTGPLVAQSPNLPRTWSPSQQPRALAYANARFEQTALEHQPMPQSAMEMIAQVPVMMVHGRKAVCDGGGGALGHPKVFINLDQPGPRSCGYCGLRFEQDHDAHSHAAH